MVVHQKISCHLVALRRDWAWSAHQSHDSTQSNSLPSRGGQYVRMIWEASSLSSWNTVTQSLDVCNSRSTGTVNVQAARMYFLSQLDGKWPVCRGTEWKRPVMVQLLHYGENFGIATIHQPTTGTALRIKLSLHGEERIIQAKEPLVSLLLWSLRRCWCQWALIRYYCIWAEDTGSVFVVQSCHSFQKKTNPFLKGGSSSWNGWEGCVAVYCSKHLPTSNARRSWLLVSVPSLPFTSLVLRHCTTSSWDRDD